MLMNRRPDRGYGLDRSSEFPVLIGLGPVQSRSFSSLETGPSNTNGDVSLNPWLMRDDWNINGRKEVLSKVSSFRIIPSKGFVVKHHEVVEERALFWS